MKVVVKSVKMSFCIVLDFGNKNRICFCYVIWIYNKMIRLFKIVLKNFVKKCFLKKYVEGYKSEVVIKVFFFDEMFYWIFYFDFNWNISILIECSINMIIYI